MKYLYFSLISVLLFASCTKVGYGPDEIDTCHWMRTHEQGYVAYVDNYTGNYIVETSNGYTVIESRGAVTPRDYDEIYANFSSYGPQSIYNYDGNYFTNGRIVEYWLSWRDALYVLDELDYYK